nr:T9SS type B sorting domain-containing protein [uncultured Flavobacterium sp.]
MKKPTMLQMLSLEYFCLFSKNSLLFLTTFVTTNPVTNKNKKRFLSNAFAMVGILLFMTQGSYGQNLKPFNIRFDRNVKGDQLLIGNNILSQDNTNFNDKDSYNSDIDMKYVDIDGDASTFSSSSAVLTVPNSNAPAAACYKIAYAALYWSAIIKNGDNSVDRTKFTSIKFKTPVGGYNDITGELIYDAINQPNGIGSDRNRPYACYADVTSLLQPLTNANGTYTVANVLSSTGYNSNTGLSAGWSLYIVYEDPKLPARSITSYDGFSGIGGATTLDINVSGFRTIPSGPVNASFAFAALEGDKPIPGDYLQINGITQSAETATGTTLRATNNFFNSSVTYINPVTKATANFTSPNRIPSSSNTLGYDAGIITLKNDNNSAIGNNATTAKITLGSTQDVYFYYFNAIAVEIIEPKIILTKKVFDDNGLPAENKAVGLGAILKYELQFQNVGNDNAKNFTISDVLPANTIFNYPADIETPLQAGVTHTYNSATRTITFTIADNLVTKNGNLSVPIRFKVQVVPTCANLTEPCNNIIKNTAKSKYTGEINTNGGLGFGEDSFSSYSACDISVPESTNFLVGVDDCKARNAVLCGDPLTISATGGYASYSWSTSPTGVPVIGTTQAITVTQPGTYYVKNTATPPCVDLEEVITVKGYDAKFNPLVKYADNKDAVTGEIPVCPNDGSVLPKIFLCGDTDKEDIDLSSLGATNITWETTTCVADPNLSDLCANEDPTCTWTQAGPPGATFTANTPGQYRVSMSFGGCFSRFYFNVYKNDLKPTASKKDIICGNNGSITIGGISGTGYEYSLSENSGYQSSNVFSISTAGTYTVYIRQVGVATNPCPFKVEGIPIYKIDFNPIAPFVTQPLCHDSKGSIKVYGTAYNGAQYTYELFKGGVSIEKVINSTSSENEFINKDAGSYTYTVTTLDGCSYNGVAEIIAPAALTAVASITKPLTCANGEITVTPTNGTAPYYYYVNGSTTSQTDPKIVITTAGTYSILVRDKNNCSYTIPDININANPKPLFTVTKTDVLCYGANTGAINFNVTNANGYTLGYSIDNGTTYVANGTFSSLGAGTYKPILKYTLSGVDCFETRPDIIITEPAAALTASAGVSELAGCGPAREGKVRITNPQGGVAPYEYSFDNQATWSSTIMDAYKAPGTYTLYIRDFNKCVFGASVIVDPEPAEPVINVTPQIDFNCDGTATSTVTVANPPNASYTYDYYLDGVKNTNVPSNVFVNVPSGSHSIKVEYLLNNVPTYSNLLFEDFGKDTSVYTATSSPDSPSPGINPAFCWERQINATRCNNNRLFGNGEYTVTSSLRNNPYGGWHNPIDHTAGTPPPGVLPGRYLAVDAGNAIPNNAVLYRKQIKDIIPNQPIKVRFYATNLLKIGNNQPDASLTVEVQNSAGVSLSSSSTGGIPNTNGWVLYEREINPGANTTLDFVLRLELSQVDGIDFAVDDIEVYQLPKTCISSKSFPLTIDPGKAFTAQITGQKNVTCNGLTNGEFTITATNFDTTKGYEYSINNGANWSAALFTSPVTVNNLAGNLYKVIVRPVGSSVATCAKPFDVNISAPAAVTLSASVTTQPTCTTGATITAIGGGGTPTYQYELRQSDGITVVTAYSNNGGVFTNVPSGSYTVFVRDANLCVIPTGVPVTVSAVPTLAAALATTTDYCYTTTNPATLDVTVTGGVGPYTFKLNTNAAVASAATTYSFTNVAPGTHTIVVTDTNNCTATISSIVIAPQLGLAVTLLNDLTCLTDASIGNPVITGGNGAPYTYTVSQNGGTPVAVSAFPYSATAAGTYVFTVNDSKGCPAASNTITVTAKTTPTITTNKTDITCNNANDGTITVTASGGFTSAYTYEIAGPVTVSQNTNVFTGLPAGTYTVSVTDSKGCPSLPVTVTIANPNPIAANASATSFSCSPTNTKQAAIITVAPTGGTGTYTYSYDNGVTFVNNATRVVNDNGLTQTFNIVVKDANGCLSPMEAIVLAPLNKPTDLAFANAAVTCTAPTTSVTITATNGVGTLQYETIAPSVVILPKQTSNVFAGLGSGSYTFRVTDANGCYYTESYEIKAVVPIAIAGNVTSDVDCYDNSTGNATFTVSGNAGAYTYVLTAGTLGTGTLTQSGNTLSLNNVKDGTYTIEVTDTATGCQDDFSVMIKEPTDPLAITSAIPTNVNCNNDNSQITVTATGGTANYSYAAVVSGATAPTVFATSNVVTVDTNATANLAWDVYVKDANGCTTSTTVTVISDALPAITVAVDDQCLASGSVYTITATPSVASLTPVTFDLSATGSFTNTTGVFTVPAGTYTVYIKDKNGCVVPAPAPTVVYPKLTASAAVTKTLDCSTSPDAVITTTITGGRAPFTYTVQKGTGAVSASSTPSAVLTFTTSVTNADADTYTFVITDANGCQATTSTTISAITNPTVVATPTMVSCNGGTNGSVILAGSGGLGGYTYSKDNVTFVASGLFSGLAASATPYTFYVKDSKGCIGSIDVTITEPTALVVSASATSFSCDATNVKQSAVVTIDVPTTGTAPYEYSFNGGSYSSVRTLTVNDNGTDQTINYSVRDAKGCITPGTAIILNGLNPPTIATITNSPIYCAPASSTTSTVTVPVTAGTGVAPLAYTIVSGPVTNTSGATTGSFSGLTAGTYVFRVTDANGCYATKSHTVPALTSIAVTATKLTDVDCFGNTTGSIRYNVSGFSGTYSYTINGGTAVTGQTATTFTLSGLSGTITYDVEFTDTTTGCIAPTSVIISQPTAALGVTIVSNKNANCNVATARVEVLANNGTPSYTYAFMQDGVAPSAANYTASAIANLNPATNLNWDVWVKDSKGCTVKLDVVIATDPTPTVTATATGQCLGVGTFTITANNTTPAAGIVTPITYSLNGGTFQSGNTFTVTSSGDYTVRMKDGNGCIVTAAIITVAPQLTLTAVLNKDITCNPAPTAAQITLTPSGGSGSFIYAITTPLAETSNVTGATTGVFTTNTAGSYTFTVTDTTTGCTYTTTTAIEVTTPVNPDITSLTQTAAINCNGDDTGAIKAIYNASLGQAPFQFSIDGTTFQNSDTFTGLSAGAYTVTIRDAKGCTDTEPYTITEPDPIVIDFDTEDLKCTDDGTGTGTNIVKGKIIINSVTGGTPSYNYYVTGINGYSDSRINITGTAFFDIVDFGLYQIRVTDANGCSALVSDIKIASPPDELVIDVNTSATCAGGSAEVKIGTALASAGPFHFAVYTGAGQTYTPPTTLPWQDEDAPNSKKTTFTGLIPGVTYTFIVFDDATDCYYYQTADTAIPSTTNLAINNFVPNNITCTSANDGNVSFDIFNGNAYSVDVNYQVYEDFTNLLITGVGGTATISAGGTHNVLNLGTLPVGSYYVLVQETSGANAGCSAISAPFNIKKSPVELSIIANVIKNSNCNDLGIIMGQAKEGTGPYTYQVTISATPPSASDINWLPTNTFTRAGSLAGTTYYVYAKDAYGCIKSDDVILLQDALPTITAAPPAICYDGSTAFTLDLSTVFSATILPATYKVVPSASSGTIAYQSGATFTFNAADTYRLFIKDGNGCEAFVDYVVRPQLQLSPSLTKELDCNLPTPNATVTVTASGGSGAGSYTYTITAGPVVNTTGATTGIFTGLDAGNYTFEVNDGACTATATFTIDPLVPIAPTATVGIPLCVGDNANVEINATGGTGSYEFKKGLAGVYSSTNIFSQTALEGAVTYYVKDTNDCEFTVVATVVDPTPLGVPTIAVTPLTCGTGNVPNGATITVTASGGAGGYEYSFDNGTSYSSSNSITNAIAGTYEIIVKDANGCLTVMQSIVIAPLDSPTEMDITGTPVYCTPVASQTSTATISNVQDGVGTFTYQIISPLAAIINNGTNAVFTGLAPDTYVFQVTDANGCTYQESYTVAPVTPIALALTGVSDVTCNETPALNNGSATFKVTDFTSYTAVLTTGTGGTITQAADIVTLTGLAPDTYTLQVTDATTGCTADVSFAIAQPTVLGLTVVSNVNANCNSGALVTVQGTGGTPSYTYAFVADGVTPIATDYTASNNATLAVTLPSPNNYDVWVKDANDCTFKLDVAVAFDATPTIVAPAAQCFVGTPISIDLSTLATVPMGPAQFYTVNGSNQLSSSYIITTPGVYTFSVTDANGCPSNVVTYTVQPQLLANAVLTKDLYCAAPVNATIDVTITDGVAPYSYQMLLNGTPSGVATPVVGSTFTASVPTAGLYSFVITDSNAAACTVTTNVVEVTTPATPTFTEVHTNVTCDAGSDGTITVTPANGIASYTFVLSGPVVNTTGDATGIYTGLPAGSYTVVVTDAKGCTSVAAPAIPITAPAVVSATISVTTGLTCGAGNATQAATVTAQGFGGNGSYQYNFNNEGFTANNSYVTNTAGPVDVIVRDGNGCSFTTAVSTTVAPLHPPTDMNISGTPIYCVQQGLGDVTSTVTVTTTNGVGALTYAILSPATATGNTSGATSGIFTLLAPDTYTFQVTDANGCTYQESYTVAPVTNITVAASAFSNVTCFGLANGTAIFDVANFAGNYNYTFDSAPIVNGVNTAQLTFTALAPGLHTLVVTDAITGCQATANVTISQPAAALDFNATATNINCNNDEATITVTATGGTIDYKYAVVPTTAAAPAPTAYGLSNQLSVDTNSGANMVWDVYVMDVNGCVTFKPVTILTDANPTIASAVATQCPSATGTYDITVTATGFSTALEYSADGTNYQTGNVITVNAPGNYTVTVRDANGCISVGFPVAIVDPLILTPTVTTPVSCADGDGVVTVSTTGGSGNYVYNIDGGAFASVTSFSNVASGNHTIGVRDTTTLCEVFATVNLQVATPVTGFALAKTEVTCNGGSDGTIKATMNTPAPGVNDNPVYTYTLTGTTTVGNLPITRPAQASPLFSGLAAGTYTVVVTSERGCTATETITIIEPGLITVPAPTVVQFACTTGNTANLATITVTGVTGGSGTYLNYEFIKVGTPTNTVVQFSNSNVYTEADLLGGSYIVNVYDDKGCIGTSTASIDIAPYIQLDQVNVVVDQAITCTNLENITVTATTIGGSATNLQYTLVDVTYDTTTTPPTAIKGSVYPAVTNATGIFTNLPVGNYEITVRNLDTNCEIIGVHYVNNPDTFDLTIDNVVDVTCFGGTNGSARVTLIDRVPTLVNNAGEFDYTVTGPTPSTGTSTAAGVVDLTNLAVGTYTITATLNQTPFCTVSKNFTITGPTAALVIDRTFTAITCVPGNDGSISATATGGWAGGYEFRLEETLAGTVVSDWSVTSTFNGLTEGNYVVKGRDSKGCEVFTTVVLNNPTPIAFTATPSTTLVACIRDTNASITVSVPTGGQGSNYLYTLNTTSATPMISSGPQSGNVFNNLGAGTYTVTVTDGWGCGTTSAPIVINEPTEVVASLVQATTPTCNTPATITLSANGGTGAYEYSTTAAGTWVAMTGNAVTISVAPGNYRYFVRDANGCSSIVSNDINVEPIPTLQVALDVQNAKINCNGDTNGVIVATATGGLGNYVYTLLDGTGNPIVPAPTQLTPGNFTQLPAGTYQVRVDSQDCTVTSTGVVTITEPLLPVTASTVVTPVTCNGAANGIITVTASGGTGVIKYAISPRLDQFFDTGVFDQLAPGTYQIIVQDENGCFILLSEEITEPQPIFVNTEAGSEVQELCAGDNNAAFDVNITGGVAPYSVTLDDINGTYVTGALSQTVFNFTGLSGGEHTVYIKDANGCTAEWIVALDESVNLDPKATVAYGCDNNSPSSTVTVTVDASITNPADVDYALDGSTVFQASNIFSNLAPGFHTITARHSNGCEKTTIQFEVLGFTPLALTLSDGGLNEIVATATGGAGNYQYSFDGGNTFSSNNKLIYYKSGDYTVIVRDANGCEATATRYFEFIDIEIPNVFTPNGDGNNDTWTPTNTINYKDLTINIFDRYGRKVATLREGQGWDGKYNSLELPSGDYWYVLKLRNVQDDREFVGHFTLMR